MNIICAWIFMLTCGIVLNAAIAYSGLYALNVIYGF